MTKTEARKWARISRSQGRSLHSPTETNYACPLPTGSLKLHHTVTVFHDPYQTPTAPQIDKAFLEHFLTEFEEDRCPTLNAA